MRGEAPISLGILGGAQVIPCARAEKVAAAVKTGDQDPSAEARRQLLGRTVDTLEGLTIPELTALLNEMSTLPLTSSTVSLMFEAMEEPIMQAVVSRWVEAENPENLGQVLHLLSDERLGEIWTSTSHEERTVVYGQLTEESITRLPDLSIFQISTLTVSPDQLKVGDNASVTVEVTNVGDWTGTITVDVKLDDVSAASKPVTVDAGKSASVGFTLSSLNAGVHIVKVGELSGFFTVSEEPVEPVPEEIYEWVGSLQAPVVEAGAEFGGSIDISQDTIVVGACMEDLYGAPNAGRVYLFDPDMSLRTTIVSQYPESDHMFGHKVAVSGDTIVVGELGVHSGSMEAAGAIRLYDTDGRFREILDSHDPQENARFSMDFSVDGGLLVVGEPQAGVGGVSDAGMVHVYDLNGVDLMDIQAPSPEAGSSFGQSLDIGGGLIVVGAYLSDVGEAVDAGRAYLYDVNGLLLAVLEAPVPEAGAEFGNSVSISGDTVVVGEHRAEVEGVQGVGRVYVFDSEGSLVTSLRSPAPGPDHRFGYVVDVSGDTVAVGELGAHAEGMVDSGGVHLYGVDVSYLQRVEEVEQALGLELAVSGEELHLDALPQNPEQQRLDQLLLVHVERGLDVAQREAFDVDEEEAQIAQEETLLAPAHSGVRISEAPSGVVGVPAAPRGEVCAV